MNPIRYFGTKAFSAQLEETGPSLSFKRLCTSRHVDDLQSIAFAAIFCMLLAFGFLFAAVVIPGTMHHEDQAREAASKSQDAIRQAYAPQVAPESQVARDLEAESIAYFARLKDDIVPFASAMAVLLATLSWAYQTGSRRLGAVDLFASEISAISRVCLVVGFAQNSVKKARAGWPKAPVSGTDMPSTKFTSEEHYTPVYDNNTSELQSLDFDVVTEVTQFYTYRKTMMDFLRKLAVTTDAADLAEASKHMIYMQFLMYESARRALRELIEFEPDQSVAIVNAYCNELVLFSFLKEHYVEEFQGRRLDMRIKNYATIYDLADHIRTKYDEAIRKDKNINNWEKAHAIAPEMIRRYEAMLAECNDIGIARSGTVIEPVQVDPVAACSSAPPASPRHARPARQIAR